MTLPDIHPNGTSAETLIEGYEAAYDAIRHAAGTLKNTGPNPRDFKPEALTRAADEHMSRLSKLAIVMAELGELIGHCDREKDKR